MIHSLVMMMMSVVVVRLRRREGKADGDEDGGGSRKCKEEPQVSETNTFGWHEPSVVAGVKKGNRVDILTLL
jgi:hypothetical protein